MVKTNTLWVEKYRPQTLDEFVGNQQLKDKVSIYLQKNDIPHLLFYGKAGTGKTTLSKLIRNKLKCDYLYINASDENSVDVVRQKIKSFASSMGFADIKIIILDEFDYMTQNAQAALRNLMETFSRTTRFILTCNYRERIIQPLQSRCQIFEITPPSKGEVAKRIDEILRAEQIEYIKEDLVLTINSSYPDIRRIINELQRQSINNKLIIDKQSIIQNDYKLQILDIIETQSKKDAFQNIRQLLANNQVRDFSDAYRLMYDNLDIFAKGHIAACILILAKYELNDVQVIDKEINFMACIIELLEEIK